MYIHNTLPSPTSLAVYYNLWCTRLSFFLWPVILHAFHSVFKMSHIIMVTKRQYNVSVCRMCLILVTKPNNVYSYEHCLCAHSRLLLVALDSHLKLTL